MYYVLCMHRKEDSDDDGGNTIAQYDPVTCTGRQPSSNTFVFGPKFQLNDNGTIITEEDQSFIWIDEILHKLQRPVNPLPPLPIDSVSHISTLVSGMCSIAGDNVLSGVYLLGMFCVVHTIYIVANY